MSEKMRVIVLLKALIGLCVCLLLFFHRNASGERELVDEKNEIAMAGKSESSSEKESTPEIPNRDLSLSEAREIREKLQFLKQDVEVKIAKLAAGKAAFDRSRLEVENKLKKVEEERKLLEETLQKEKESKKERLGEALAFVGKMEPRKAAPMVESMDRDLVLLLLRKLPGRQVTRILESVSPKKAAELMEYYTRIRSGREYELMRSLGMCEPPSKENDEEPISRKEIPETGEQPKPGP
jgi:flagellar motility protein MotE (MotC chaperone)